MSPQVTDLTQTLLPGIPADQVYARLAQGDGNELDGKILSPESSAALAVNAFGWFLQRPHLFPGFPGIVSAQAAPILVDLERKVRFPWPGGRHPNLDAWVEYSSILIGIESKRFEPFRDRKKPHFSSAYDRPVWGSQMAPFEQMRDHLRGHPGCYRHLDAAQLVKTAFGLVTQSRRDSRPAALVYLFAEPDSLHGRPIPAADKATHRKEIAHFAAAVSQGAVAFHAIGYREWLDTWPASPPDLAGHRTALLRRYSL